ncbi:DUF554 domain-containing protein [Caproiciproducens sp. MSJ-32]|uniref:DUF554 domain-containing protein n=1 Tax=Caproiciproducens sp. MSJ-32 TaxID=2841527 RepID=UPI001C1079A7|nr:DUF554 domain-containing protein [Caproiciproducens sp. MSJ-32]MBU5454938.1 DUF554 domain-containing protein [Caproiciproducens sp. MSJ-32]
MLGTIINSVVIIIGSFIGLIIKGKISEKIRATVMNGLGLCTLYIGILGALEGENTLIMIISIALGALVGELIDIDAKLNDFGMAIERKISKNNNSISIAEGFVSATLLFCVGAMAIVGALESGLNNNNSTLYAKSILDGISSIIFSSSLGIGVMLSSVSVFIYQGIIAFGANLLSQVLSDAAINNMTAVGSLLIVGLSFNILNITKIKISNLLPAMLIAVILSLL